MFYQPLENVLYEDIQEDIGGIFPCLGKMVRDTSTTSSFKPILAYS